MSHTPPDAAFESLPQFLERTRGFDFTGYERASMERRFRGHMEALGLAGFGDYLDYLEVHPDEYEALFDTLLINVTELFRDRRAWERLRDHALPALLAGKAADEPIRVWSAAARSDVRRHVVERGPPDERCDCPSFHVVPGEAVQRVLDLAGARTALRWISPEQLAS